MCSSRRIPSDQAVGRITGGPDLSMLMSPVPNAAISTLTVVENLVHPADQRASALIGSASAIHLQAGDSLLEIGPKNLAKTKPVASKYAKNLTEAPLLTTC